MEFQKWQVTDYGLELGEYALEEDDLPDQRNGRYATIEHVTSKTWKHYDLQQFIQARRKAMGRHGYEIDEAVFELTLSHVLWKTMKQHAHDIMEDILDPFENGFGTRSYRFGHFTPQQRAVNDAVSRIMELKTDRSRDIETRKTAAWKPTEAAKRMMKAIRKVAEKSAER